MSVESSKNKKNDFVDEIMKMYDVVILRASFDMINLLALYISS